MITQAPLPYAANALAPYISEQTLSFHYGKHHAGYVRTVNELIADTPLDKLSLAQIIAQTADDPAQRKLYNNAAQVYNHDLYWKSLTPTPTQPTGALLQKINESFGSMANLNEQLMHAALNQFGSGWAWLVLDDELNLKVVPTSNALQPQSLKHLLVIDVLEHAYYLDYQNRRAEYLKNLIEHLINWDFATQQLTKHTASTR